MSFGCAGAERAPEVRIGPSGQGFRAALREIWEHRELLLFLAWRDLKLRYRQTVLGGLWVILQPLLTMALFTLVFGRLARVPSDGASYPLFVFSALVPWTLLLHGLNHSCHGLVSSATLLKKAYFPRVIVPLSTALSGSVDLCVSLAALGILLALSPAGGPGSALLFPWSLLLVLSTTLGAGLWLSAMNVLFRDVRHALPFLTQFWFFATPVAYPSSLLPEPWRPLCFLNPMAGCVEGFRSALLGTPGPSAPAALASTITAAVLLVTGLRYFLRTQRVFADVV